MPVLDTNTLGEYIQRYQVDGVIWKANKLLNDVDNPILRNDRFMEVAMMLALIPDAQRVTREDYIKKIAQQHGLQFKTLEKMVGDAAIIHRKTSDIKKPVKKNKIITLEGDARMFKFFNEVTAENKNTGEIMLSKIKIDKYKFVQLLANFGFTRYEVGSDDNNRDGYEFVRLTDNMISLVTREQIIDHIEGFVKNEYNFEAAGAVHTDAMALINTFYDQMRTIFSKDLFARVRTTEKIIINRDTKDTCFLYFKNGFVEITKVGWTLRSYSEMNGSVWDNQMLKRPFKKVDVEDLANAGYFADFCYTISGQKEQRFQALASILGYLVHDFYDYKLKAALFTDSSLSEDSEGRTGKTLLMKLLGQVRSYTEINGKDFDAGNANKYQDVKMGTQIVHLNDVKHKGRNKFDFEDVFNDVTEGIVVNAKYLTPFRQLSKMAISTNKTLNITGASQRDRIIEFEMSDFFSDTYSPADHYGHWFISDWSEEEFNRFDNFICWCVQVFLTNGLVAPTAINLGERKLRNHTALEFLEFMEEMKSSLEKTGIPWPGYGSATVMAEFGPVQFQDFKFDKRALYDRFIQEYHDFKSWLTQRTFTAWLRHYSEHRYKVKHPKEWKSSGISMIQFIEEENKK